MRTRFKAYTEMMLMDDQLDAVISETSPLMKYSPGWREVQARDLADDEISLRTCDSGTTLATTAFLDDGSLASASPLLTPRETATVPPLETPAARFMKALNILYTNKLPLFQSFSWPIVFYGLFLHDAIQYGEYRDLRYGDTFGDLLLGSASNVKYLSSSLAYKTWFLGVMYGTPFTLFIVNRVQQRMQDKSVEDGSNRLTYSETYKILLSVFLSTQSTFSVGYLQLLLPKQLFNRQSNLFNIENIFNAIERYPVSALTHVGEGRTLFYAPYIFSHYGSLVGQVRSLIMARYTHDPIHGVSNEMDQDLKFKHSLLMRIVLLNSLNQFYRKLLVRLSGKHDASSQSHKENFMALRDEVRSILDEVITHPSSPLILRLLARYGTFRAVVGWKQLLSPAFVVFESLMVFATLRYWAMAVFYSKYAVQYWIDQADCHSKSMSWVYVPERGEYSCTTCANWEHVPYPLTETWHACYEALMRQSYDRDAASTLINRLSQMIGLYQPKGVDVSNSQWIDWSTDQSIRLFQTFNRLFGKHIDQITLSQQTINQFDLETQDAMVNFLSNRTAADLSLANLGLNATQVSAVFHRFNATLLEAMDLTGNKISDRTAAISSHYPMLQKLILDQTDPTVQDLHRMFSRLSDGFQSLSLAHNTLSSQHLDALNGLPTSVKSLDLTGVNLENVDITPLANFLASPSYEIEHLFLRDTNINAASLSALKVGLERDILMTFDFSENELSFESLMILSGVIKQSTQLETFMLSHSEIQSDLLIYIVDAIPKTLLDLDISANSLSDNFLKAWMEQGGNIPSRSLNLSNNLITQSGAQYLGNLLYHYSIQALDISNNLQIKSNGVIHLADRWLGRHNCSLTELKMDNIGMQAQGFKSIWASISGNNATLIRSLEVDNNAIGDEFANSIRSLGWVSTMKRLSADTISLSDDQAIRGLVSNLPDSNLEQLILSNNNLGSVNNIIAQALISPIPQPDSLYAYHTTTTQQKALAKVSRETGLRYLNLENTGLSTEGARALTRVADVIGMLPEDLVLLNNPSVDPTQVNLQTFWRSGARSLKPPFFYLYLFHSMQQLKQFVRSFQEASVSQFRHAWESLTQSPAFLIPPEQGGVLMCSAGVDNIIANPKSDLTVIDFSREDSVHFTSVPVLTQDASTLCYQRGQDAFFDLNGGSLRIEGQHCDTVSQQVHVNQPQTLALEILQQQGMMNLFSDWTPMTIPLILLMAYRQEILVFAKQYVPSQLQSACHELAQAPKVQFAAQITEVCVRAKTARTKTLLHDSILLCKHYHEETSRDVDHTQAAIALAWRALPVVATLATLCLSVSNPEYAAILALAMPLFIHARSIVSETTATVNQSGYCAGVGRFFEEVAFSVPGGSLIKSHFYQPQS